MTAGRHNHATDQSRERFHNALNIRALLKAEIRVMRWRRPVAPRLTNDDEDGRIEYVRHPGGEPDRSCMVVRVTDQHDGWRGSVIARDARRRLCTGFRIRLRHESTCSGSRRDAVLRNLAPPAAAGLATATPQRARSRPGRRR